MSFSIILCTYNDSVYLPKAITSCIEQGAKEIVLVDDCSSIPVIKEVMSMVDKYDIKFIKHDKNLGLSASRNTGVNYASSEWVIPLDADDWFYPGTIKRLENQGSGVDVVTGNCTDQGVYAPAISREQLSAELFKRENPLVCSSLFKKELWRTVGGYMVRKGPHYEDWNFWARCFKSGAKFKYVPMEIYHHTSRVDSMLRILHPNGAFYRNLATEGVFNGL